MRCNADTQLSIMNIVGIILNEAYKFVVPTNYFAMCLFHWGRTHDYILNLMFVTKFRGCPKPAYALTNANALTTIWIKLME